MNHGQNLAAGRRSNERRLKAAIVNRVLERQDDLRRAIDPYDIPAAIVLFARLRRLTGWLCRFGEANADLWAI
jgi:hypothetical protein